LIGFQILSQVEHVEEAGAKLVEGFINQLVGENQANL
jgi:hypothetical protein